MDRWATFDCYGTLIDWDAGIKAELTRLFGDGIEERVAEARDDFEFEARARAVAREKARVERARAREERARAKAEAEAQKAEEGEDADDGEPGEHGKVEEAEPEAAEEDEEEAEEDEEEPEFDEEAARERALDELLDRYHALERQIEKDGSLTYREVMTEVMRRLGAPAGEEGGLADSLPSWQPFPEAADVLMELRSRGWKLAILSNSDLDFIEASKSLLGVPFEETVVASQIHSYKPALMHWMEFYGRTLANRRRHIHVGASSYHDIAPARKLRIPNVWINRRGEHALTAATKELETLDGLPDIADEIIPA
jgi:2-haloacid dehalogenase